jgi:tetratricopeptide (TPR) repeat protein
MTQMTVAERQRNKRLLADEAVKLAMQNRWQEAEEKNRDILHATPDDVEARNRLGKALSELGRYREAYDEYSVTLQYDPANVIAQKQVKRLQLLAEQGQSDAPNEARRKLDPKLLVEETGKTGVFPLPNKASQGILARLAAGDELFLQVEGATVHIVDDRGDVLGELPSKDGSRLVKLMAGGNRYVAGVMSVGDRELRILVRELYQDATLVGKVSFPTRSTGQSSVHAHLRAGLERRDIDEDDMAIDDADDDAGEGEEEVEEVPNDLDDMDGDGGSRDN